MPRSLSPPPESAAAPALIWFRDDLRVSDNPALSAAAATGRPLLCVYVHDDASAGQRPLGGAAKWWLHGALAALDDSLREKGSRLVLLQGAAQEVLPALAASVGAALICWNRRYGLAAREIDAAIKTRLRDTGAEVQSFNGHLLYEPWEVRTQAGGPMKVFTPFWRAARSLGDPAPPLPAPQTLTRFDHAAMKSSLPLAALALLPTKPDWAGGLRAHWTPGEAAAGARLEAFLEDTLRGYGENRNRPDRLSTSMLSPYLRFGNISPRQIWHAAHQAALAEPERIPAADLAKFAAELGWREFSYHLLFHNHDLASRNYNPRFDAFPWKEDEKALHAWQSGRTGYPIVDAGMRQLWTTGWMHNRVRMIVASFLVKHLLIDWREGESWFWDTLVDADPASNPASWQWVAGSGADAAPYFRIFNPMLQGEKFDPDGAYIKQWIPELAHLPKALIHRPWAAADLFAAQNPDGAKRPDYPPPLVAHDAARQRALAALAHLKPNAS